MSLELSNSAETPKNPLVVIRQDIYDVISFEPTAESESSLTYTSEMSKNEFLDGLWALSLNRALEKNEITLTEEKLKMEEMSDRQLEHATHPDRPKTYYKLTLNLTS